MVRHFQFHESRAIGSRPADGVVTVSIVGLAGLRDGIGKRHAAMIRALRDEGKVPGGRWRTGMHDKWRRKAAYDAGDGLACQALDLLDAVRSG